MYDVKKNPVMIDFDPSKHGKGVQAAREAPSKLVELLQKTQLASDQFETQEVLQEIAEYMQKRGLAVPANPGLLIKDVQNYIGLEFGNEMLESLDGYIDKLWAKIQKDLKNGHTYNIIVSGMENFYEDIMDEEAVMGGDVGKQYTQLKSLSEKIVKGTLEEKVAAEIAEKWLEDIDSLRPETKAYFKESWSKNRFDQGIMRFYLQRADQELSNLVNSNQEEFKSYAKDMGAKVRESDKDPYMKYAALAETTRGMEGAYVKEITKKANGQ